MSKPNLSLILRAILNRKTQSDFVDILGANKSKVSRIFKGTLDISNIDENILSCAAIICPLPMLSGSNMPSVNISPPEFRDEIIADLLKKHKGTRREVELYVLQIRWLLSYRSSYDSEAHKIYINEQDLQKAEEMLRELPTLQSVSDIFRPVYEYFSRHNLVVINILREAVENKYFENASVVDEAIQLLNDLFSDLKSKKITAAVRENLEYLFITNSTQTKEIILLSDSLDKIQEIRDMENTIFGKKSEGHFLDFLNANAWEHSLPLIKQFYSEKKSA